MEHPLSFLVQLDFRQFRHPTRHARTDQTDQAFGAGCAEGDQQKAVESFLAVGATVRGVVDQTESQQLDTDHGSDERHDGKGREAEDL